MVLIDTHAHLETVEQAHVQLKEAAEAGVQGVVAVGVDLAANKIHLEIAKKYNSPKVFLAFGIHPGNIITEQIEPTVAFMRAHKDELVAIGEIGLDYGYPWVKNDEEKKQQQRSVFAQQLDLAREFELPVVIHSRGAWQDCFDATRAAGIKHAVFHWYGGPVDVLKDILGEGYFISATPALCYSPQLQEAVRYAPITQTLIETDTPVVYRLSKEKSFKAGPKDIFFTLDCYAKLKQVDKESAAVALNTNAKKFFSLPL